VEPPKPTENYAKVDRELVEATVQAEMIRTSAKTRAQFITNQVNSMAAEMRQVMVGKAMTGRAYSDEAIDAATFDLRNQAKSIIDGGEREASDVMNRAQLRYDAETHHNK
jgi:cbb3-type cytochrome oxidase cytochrome c subunit